MRIYVWIDFDEEYIDLDDNATDEEIENEFQSWVNGVLHCGYTIVDEDCE